MYESNPFLGGPDYSGLAETPPPPPEKPRKTPEFLDDDDDDEVEDEKPKTLRDLFEKQGDDKKEESTEEKKESDEAEEETAIETEGEETEVETETETENDEESVETGPEASAEEDSSEDVETDPDAPEMNNEEVQEAAVEIIEDSKQTASSEVEEATTPEDKTEAIAAEAFLENAKGEIEQGQPVDEALEAAKKKTLEDLNIEAPAAEDEATAEEPEVEAEATPEPPETVEIPEPVEAEEEPDPAVQPTPPPSPPTPPTPPSPPYGGGGPGGFGGPGGPFGPGVAGGNVLPTTPNVLPVDPPETDTSNRRARTGGAVLAGGLVGYLLGRRRGRIKTEKKLLPIQHKLEKEVAQLQDKIFWHEAGVRSLAHEHAVKNPEAAERAAERLKAVKQAEAKPASPTEQINEQKAETRPEAVVEHKTDAVQSEKIGKMIFEAEEPKMKPTETIKTPEQLKPVDLMTVPELLAVAEQIEIEQSNIRRLYEANRLDYEGLRRIVRAYLRGERYDKLLHDYLLTPEKYAYAETLSPNGIDAAKMPAAAPQDGFVSGQDGSTPLAPQNPYGSQQPGMQAYGPPNPTDETATKKAPPVGAVVAVGVIIAVLLLIFMVAR